ncbi:MAG: hypothetical protein Q7S54_01500 [bacterium]|nr:hypothetical protein [bacterium]
MLSFWGMAVLAVIFAVWFHWESGIWRLSLSKSFISLIMVDTGAMTYLGLAVYMTAAY